MSMFTGEAAMEVDSMSERTTRERWVLGRPLVVVKPCTGVHQLEPERAFAAFAFGIMDLFTGDEAAAGGVSANA